VSPVSVTYWGASGCMLFSEVLFAHRLRLFAAEGFFLLFRLLRLGKKGESLRQGRAENQGDAGELIPQWCTLKTVTRSDRAGDRNTLCFSGASALLRQLHHLYGLAGGFGLSPLIERTPFETVYFSILDIAAALVTLTLIVAAVRRYVIRPQRLEPTAEAGIILMMVFSLMVLHVFGVGFDHAARGFTLSWPPPGGGAGRFPQQNRSFARRPGGPVTGRVWWLHYPRDPRLHGLYSPRPSTCTFLPFPVPMPFFKPLGPKVALEPIPLEESETFGVSKIQEFTWKDLLDLYACAVCGRCHVKLPCSAHRKIPFAQGRHSQLEGAFAGAVSWITCR